MSALGSHVFTCGLLALLAGFASNSDLLVAHGQPGGNGSRERPDEPHRPNLGEYACQFTGGASGAEFVAEKLNQVPPSASHF